MQRKTIDLSKNVLFWKTQNSLESIVLIFYRDKWRFLHLEEHPCLMMIFEDNAAIVAFS